MSTTTEPAAAIRTVSLSEVPANRRRGGDIRTLLSPATVSATSGFLGTLTLADGEVVTEHWHPVLGRVPVLRARPRAAAPGPPG
jgi:hypothetical protein